MFRDIRILKNQKLKNGFGYVFKDLNCETHTYEMVHPTISDLSNHVDYFVFLHRTKLFHLEIWHSVIWRRMYLIFF